MVRVETTVNGSSHEAALMSQNNTDAKFGVPLANHGLPQSELGLPSPHAAFDIALTTAMLTLVIRGSRIVEQQRRVLIGKVRRITHLLSRNSQLQQRAAQASQRAALENEHALHRLGADLHDGPAQLISFALLRLDSLSGMLGGSAVEVAAASHIEGVRRALTDAMSDVRSISAGLSMPRIAAMPIADAFTTIIAEHERRTGTVVTADLKSLPLDTPYLVKMTLCRFVQEGLNNAFRHAGGKCQSVNAWTCAAVLWVEIADEGPGMAPPSNTGVPRGLGLIALSNRIESLGGHMRIYSRPGEGTRLTANVPVLAQQGSIPP